MPPIMANNFAMSKRDPNGPDHKPTIRTDYPIDGVTTMVSPYVEYLSDSILTELYRPEWIGVFGKNEPIDHLYTVKAPSGGIRKEWYYHEHTLDRYMLLEGQLDVGLYDGRQDSTTFKGFCVVSLGEPGSGLPNGIRIPPLVWHSLKWVSGSGMFLNAKTPPFRSQKPDKFRVAPDDYPSEIHWDF
jgi:dTDP-4-dehydrorhamnose 3,5-epimerase-like enzyme